MHTDPLTESLRGADLDTDKFLQELKLMPDTEMIPGSRESAWRMMARAAVLIADGEPICLGILDDDALYIIDPDAIGYFRASEPWQLDHTIGWLEELQGFFATMTASLKEIRARKGSAAPSQDPADGAPPDAAPG